MVYSKQMKRGKLNPWQIPAWKSCCSTCWECPVISLKLPSMDVCPCVHMLWCGAGLGEERPGAREWDVGQEVGEKKSGEKELREVRENKPGVKEPAVAPRMGKRECSRYAVTITGVSATVGSACGIICIQQIWDESEGSHQRTAGYWKKCWMVSGGESSSCFISCRAALGESLASAQLQWQQRGRNQEEKNFRQETRSVFLEPRVTVAHLHPLLEPGDISKAGLLWALPEATCVPRRERVLIPS